MKKAIKLTLAVVLVMGATSLFAQKFGRINTQEIIMAMPETKTMQENMDSLRKDLSDNMETIDVEFNNKLQDFQKNYTTMSDAVAPAQGEGTERFMQTPHTSSRSAHSRITRRNRTNCSPRSSTRRKRHRQGSGRRRISGRVRHVDGIAGLLRRGYADGRRACREEGTGHHRRPAATPPLRSTCGKIR